MCLGLMMPGLSPRNLPTSSDVLADLTEAMNRTGHTYDSIAAHFSQQLRRKFERGEVWKMLNGHRPWKHSHEAALPDDMAGAYYELRAQRFGRLVVEPAEGSELETLKRIVSYALGAMRIKPGRTDILERKAG